MTAFVVVALALLAAQVAWVALCMYVGATRAMERGREIERQVRTEQAAQEEQFRIQWRVQAAAPTATDEGKAL